MKTALFMVKLRILRDAEGAAALLAIDELDSVLEAQQSSEEGASPDTRTLVRSCTSTQRASSPNIPSPQVRSKGTLNSPVPTNPLLNQRRLDSSSRQGGESSWNF